MFGSLKGKIKRWQEAGLVTSDQTTAILAFERTRKSGKLIKDLTNVGIFAILLGLASLVAANWNDIPAQMKLIGHFALCGGLVAFMLRIDGAKHPVGKDACVLLLFGSFLTFIALIGQVYQLHGDLHATLLLWLAICTPFVWFYGRTYTVAVPWLLVFLATLFFNITHYLEDNDDQLVLVGSLIAFYLPMALLLAARLPWLCRHRDGFAATFYRMGIYLPALMTTCAVMFFYEGNREIAHHALLIALMALGLFAMFLIFRPKFKADEQAADLWYYLLVSHIIIMLPFVFPELRSEVLSAALFCLYWIFIAWLGARMHAVTLTDWAIRLVILRLFIVYLEVFGSMLQTGVGLIVSGILLLVVLRYLNRIVAVGRKLVNYET